MVFFFVIFIILSGYFICVVFIDNVILINCLIFFGLYIVKGVVFFWNEWLFNKLGNLKIWLLCKCVINIFLMWCGCIDVCNIWCCVVLL